MNDVTIRLLYIESTTDEVPFAWYEGKALTPGQHTERAQIHQEMNDIVNGSESGTTAEWGRAIRYGHRLLVEVPMDPTADVTDRLTATVVVSVSRADTDWSNGTAKEISAVLNEFGFSMPADRLAAAFVEGWRRKRPFSRAIPAVGTALVMALWWVLRTLRLRRRRRMEEENTQQPSMISTTKEH